MMKRHDSRYADLMRKVKDGQREFDVEWMVKRNDKDNTDWTVGSINFNIGELGWLGNMTPAEECYYLKAAIIASKNGVA